VHNVDNPLESYLERCRDLIARHGHFVQSVAGSASTPAWSYSVGLTTVLGFEVVILGLPMDTAGALINALAAKLKQCAIADGADLHGLANMPLRLMTVRAGQCELTIARRLGYVPTHVRIIQWPDPKGRFPGETGYSSLLTQTFLDIASTARAH